MYFCINIFDIAVMQFDNIIIVCLPGVQKFYNQHFVGLMY